MRLSSVTLVAALASLASAHPGHDLTEEILERRQFINSVHRKDLSHCSEKLRARGFESRSIARRAAAVEEARARRGFSKRDTADFLAASHDRSNLGYTESTDASVLFSDNASCLLTPEMAQGPFYVSGEFVRDDITDGQPGIDLTLEYQVIDVDTCEPVPDVYVEIWHCNSTGVYSGVVASGNGDAEDETNMDTIFLRGIQKSDSEGVTQFKSIFPGHYPGRAPHVHVMVHTNATLMANETLGNDVYASHLGQVFFDQDLIMSVRKMAPYSTNTQELMLNANDRIVREEVGDVVDPFMNYVFLGDDLDSGLFAYMAFGINSSYTRHVTPTANYYQDGGVALPKPGNGAGPGGNGATPGSMSTAATETSTAAAALATLPLYGAVAGGVGLAMLLQ